MTKELAIESLTRFKNAKDKSELSQIHPDDPLFLIRYISKNTRYFELLNHISSQHYDEVLSFNEHLKTHAWDLDMIRHIQENYPNYSFNHGFDLVYIAYLSQLISRELFYDFVIFQSIIQSFTGQASVFTDNRKNIVQVPPLPEIKSIKKHLSSSIITQSDQMKHYISRVRQVFIDSRQFCFSDSRFANTLDTLKEYCIFEIEINNNAFQSMASVWPHNIWFDLFFHSPQYGLIQEIINPKTNKISILIPGDSLLSAFTAAITPDPGAAVKPVYAFGIVSNSEESRLHEIGYHLVSLLDPRFKSLVRLHGRIGNPLECILHDTLFHSIIISSHPQYIRHIFSKIYKQLDSISITNPELALSIVPENIPHELLALVLNEFKSRCIGFGRLFNRHPEDYESRDYYFKEILKSVLLGTVNQVLFELPTPDLNTEEVIKQILILCCTYLNNHRIADVPEIPIDWVHQFFSITNEGKEIIMRKDRSLMSKEKEIEAEIANLNKQLKEKQNLLEAIKTEGTTRKPGFFAHLFSSCLPQKEEKTVRPFGRYSD